MLFEIILYMRAVSAVTDIDVRITTCLLTSKYSGTNEYTAFTE